MRSQTHNGKRQWDMGTGCAVFRVPLLRKWQRTSSIEVEQCSTWQKSGIPGRFAPCGKSQHFKISICQYAEEIKHVDSLYASAKCATLWMFWRRSDLRWPVSFRGKVIAVKVCQNDKTTTSEHKHSQNMPKRTQVVCKPQKIRTLRRFACPYQYSWRFVAPGVQNLVECGSAKICKLHSGVQKHHSGFKLHASAFCQNLPKCPVGPRSRPISSMRSAFKAKSRKAEI